MPDTIGAAVLDPEDQLNRAFMALADPVRRKILARLALGDATVNEIAQPFTMTLQAISKHLQVLEGAGLITRSREAQRRPCHLNTTALGPLAEWIENYRLQAEERFARLDELLAGKSPYADGNTADPVERGGTAQENNQEKEKNNEHQHNHH
ncbi:ArsR/SmtB family transcription factor [Arthrobacter bambusae]|uniref:ArsR/SmtB family transcription factor n=1 Tax=Arthrobacter bambusae TaxID=1338426 RepID=UPI002789E59D|nr:metalloregulator ArsR/SmtB family transcription factor [Arthrobacter bambusae]MDQ0029792.1 DNA-binding transcriptional ArsR family regulator [Arthrobacter bambusae]MDQ0097690.1 DNA-binding transcriptional ArsR family regulator [Arthrobacter bambusae]